MEAVHAQRRTAFMRAGGEDGGHEHTIGPGALGFAQFACVMRRGEAQQTGRGRAEAGGRAVDSVRPPFDGLIGGARQNDAMRVFARPLYQLGEPRGARQRVEVIMPEHEARLPRQAIERLFDSRIVARIGEQPEERQRGGRLANSHQAAIARAMTERAPVSTPLALVRETIAHSCKIARREPEDVTLIAVSKTRSAEDIMPLLEQGQRVFGENRVQEAQAKWPELRESFPDSELHLIGQLQSNKAEDAAELFDCIHALDRPSLVKALGKAFDKTGRRVPCFVQVDVGDEKQKGGCPVGELPALLKLAREADIPVRGLMCLPPADIEPAPFFALLGKLAMDHGLADLSMGMSGDYETAIMLGATHVRVGTALFGPRN